LVQALARCSENGKQRCERYCALSGMELARVKISIRRTQNHCVRPRNDGYRSGTGHHEG
jgi:hypothetical protein